MLVLKISLICISVWLTAIIAGLIYKNARKDASFAMSSVWGLLTMWGLFWPCAVFCIVKKLTLTTVMELYLPVLGAWCVFSVVIYIFTMRKKEKSNETFQKFTRAEVIYLGLFLGIVLYQLFKSVFFSYADGDDSYYVAMAQSARTQGSLYAQDAYTGASVELATRYAFSPFPIFISLLSQLSGINAVTVAHICMPVILIPITYVIFNNVATSLFGDNRAKRYMFLTLSAVFVMFGGYSFNTAEMFMLSRARQGKEALASIVIPALFALLLSIIKEEEKKITWKNYIAIIFLSISAALCSMFGNVLVLLMLFAYFVYLFFVKASWMERIKSASLAVPCLAIVGLYLLI